jgi:hypothetical protein
MWVLVLVGKSVFESVVVGPDVLYELLEVDDNDALVLDTPIVAASETPSFSSQHVVFPP